MWVAQMNLDLFFLLRKHDNINVFQHDTSIKRLSFISSSLNLSVYRDLCLLLPQKATSIAVKPTYICPNQSQILASTINGTQINSLSCVGPHKNGHKEWKVLYILIWSNFQYMLHEQKRYFIPFVSKKNKIIFINEFVCRCTDSPGRYLWKC